MKFPWSKRKKSVKRSASKRQELDNAKVDVEIQEIEQQKETDKIIHNKLKNAIEKDPDLYRGLIAKKYDISLGEPMSIENQVLREAMQDDPEFRENYKHALITEKEREGAPSSEEIIENIISEQVMTTVSKDPSILSGIVQKRLKHLGGSSGGSFGNILEELEAMEDLKHRFGGGDSKNPLAGLITPEVVTAAIGLIGQITGKPSLSQIAPVSTIKVLDTEGNIVEVSEEEFKRIEQVNAKQIAEGEEIPSTEAEEYPQPPIVNVPNPTSSGRNIAGITAENLLDFLDEDPDAFVQMLHDKKSTNIQLQLFWDSIKGSEKEDLMLFLSGIKDEEFKPVITRLSTGEGQEWLGVVVRLVKEWKDN